MVLRCTIMTIMLFLAEALAQCNHGEVRLVGGHSPNEGIVEVCACTCTWGTVCYDSWGRRDAQVVCRQLGYKPDGAQVLYSNSYRQVRILLDNIMCDTSEVTLLDCEHDGLLMHNCYYTAGVRCAGSPDSSVQSVKNVMNVSVNVTSIISIQGIKLYTVLITWKLQNISYQPSMYEVECLSNQHRIVMSVNSTTTSIQLVGLLSTTSYNCCVSAVYGSYTARAVCTEIVTIQPPTSDSETPSMLPSSGSTVKPESVSTIEPSSESPTVQLNTCKCETQGSSSRALNSDRSADTIGGVLGFIIAILFILLALSGATIVYLLRLKSSVAADRSSTDVPLRTNMSYTTTPSHSTTSGPHVTQATRPGHGDQTQTESETADEYSRIGPSYTYVTAQVRRQQPATVAGRNRVSASVARFSERYEFSEAHLTTAGGSHGDDGAYGILGGEVGEDVQRHNMQIEERDEYSHLQY